MLFMIFHCLFLGRKWCRPTIRSHLSLLFIGQTVPYVFAVDLNSDIDLNSIGVILTRKLYFRNLLKLVQEKYV